MVLNKLAQHTVPQYKVYIQALDPSFNLIDQIFIRYPINIHYSAFGIVGFSYGKDLCYKVLILNDFTHQGQVGPKVLYKALMGTAYNRLGDGLIYVSFSKPLLSTKRQNSEPSINSAVFPPNLRYGVSVVRSFGYTIYGQYILQDIIAEHSS